MKLKLKPTNKQNLYIGTRKDGSNYSVRGDRKRYFFPDEWEKFYNAVKTEKGKMFFLTALHTGGRAIEILHLKPKDFDYDRKSITFNVVKQRKAKKNFYATGKNRTFFVSNNYLKKIKSYINSNKIPQKNYIFLNNDKLPKDYENFPNDKKKKHFFSAFVTYSKSLKYYLAKAGIKDFHNFSLHNLRKTYGNWMRIYNIRTEEVCYRLGHDMETYMAHYGSPQIFTEKERHKIMSIMGDVQ